MGEELGVDRGCETPMWPLDAGGGGPRAGSEAVGQGRRSGTRTSLGDKDVPREGEAGEGGEDGRRPEQGEVTGERSPVGEAWRSPAGQARSRLAAAGRGQGDFCQSLFFRLSARSCTSPLLCPMWFVTRSFHSQAKSAFLENAHTSCQLPAGLPC